MVSRAVVMAVMTEAMMTTVVVEGHTSILEKLFENVVEFSVGSPEVKFLCLKLKGILV